MKHYYKTSYARLSARQETQNPVGKDFMNTISSTVSEELAVFPLRGNKKEYNTKNNSFITPLLFDN
jgi:hypothetical protein